MQKITVQITENDIRENERFCLNPLIYVLQRLTGTLWQLDENGLLAEAMEPFRACQLSPDIMRIYRNYQKTGKMSPVEIELKFHYTTKAFGDETTRPSTSHTLSSDRYGVSQENHAVVK